jgi:hypothetical protein
MSVKCTTFLKFMETGASSPFLGTSDSGQKFVVKVHGNCQGVKSIFNELVAGRLAAVLNLPWPTVSIVYLADHVIELLISKHLPVLSPWAVGLGYIEDLCAIPWPPGGSLSPK